MNGGSHSRGVLAGEQEGGKSKFKLVHCSSRDRDRDRDLCDQIPRPNSVLLI
jgi:hypothetical protein